MTTLDYENRPPRPGRAAPPLRGARGNRHPENADRGAFVAAMRNAVAGVTVVTTAGRAGCYGLTVSAVTSVSADPPLILACINRRSPVCVAVQKNGAFCVNLLATHQREIAEVFAGRSSRGRAYDFRTADWETGTGGVPYLVDAVSSFDCILETATQSGSHTIFVGKVVAVRCGRGSPLLYSDRAYGRPDLWH